MSTVTIKLEGLDKVLDMLEPKQYQRVVKATMRDATQLLKRDLQEYPGKANWLPGKASSRWTDKQRRWFFANLREGKIEVPYRRTGTLGKGWTSRVKQRSGWIVGVVGNRIGYAREVQDKAKRHWEHGVTGWPTVQDVVKKRERDIVRLFEAAIDKALRLRR